MSLDLLIDDAVAVPRAVRRQLRVEVARMIRATARHDRRTDYEVSLRLVDDAAIHALNHTYRHKDKPTDVLAFAQRESPGGSLHPEILGDIVISVETARRQARRGLYRELLHLASHGLCHLLGYDHRDDDEERVMNARAAALRAEAGRRGRIRAA
ncbi:MAG TPA: rRNA maturation RNase YbeY [Kofleriaceae bacterium]|jgi:probable rRNA maturation factor|nr:rRNA maturation RNase YbeY [Kofleriaceae bacterium]